MVEKGKCQYCGKEVAKPDLKDHEKECSKNPNIKGFDGWLNFFGFCLVIGIIFNIYWFFSSLYLIDSILYGIFSVYGVLIFYFYINKKREFIPNVKIYLWINIILSVIVYSISYSEGGYIGGIIVAILWLVYFYRSRRVKNTFTNKTEWLSNILQRFKDAKF